MDELNYLSRPPRRTHNSLLGDLHALNRQFLALVLADEALADAAGLDRCTQQAIGGLSENELLRLATCPYSLFDLGFADSARWDLACEHSTDTDQSDHGGAFVLATLLYARQLCQHHDDMARLLLGMTDDVVRLLERRDVAELSALAFDGSQRLKARLADHAHFWSDILDFVRDGTRERQLAAHTLGVQHSAAKFRR